MNRSSSEHRGRSEDKGGSVATSSSPDKGSSADTGSSADKSTSPDTGSSPNTGSSPDTSYSADTGRFVGRTTSREEKTLLWSLLLSSPGPLVTGFAALSSRSATQLADFLRRTTELIAIFVSWRVYRILGRGSEPDVSKADDEEGQPGESQLSQADRSRVNGEREPSGPREAREAHEESEAHHTGAAQRTRLKRLANLWVGGAMLISGVVMLCIAIFDTRLGSSLGSSAGSSSHQSRGNVIPGLTIAILGLLTNTWFWIRYRAMNKERFDSVIAAQSSLYRAKSLVDLCVVVALGAVAAAPDHPATGYVDAVGSAIVSLFLIWNGLKVVRKDVVRKGVAQKD